jgi:glycosyltransferase involved in cell wall biosynthesis
LVSYKGLFELLEAWFDVARSLPGATLVLVGEGSADIDNCERELREQVASLDMKDQVIFAGAVDNVQDYLKCADVFVFPSRNEAFGLSVIEAMAAGLPVVSSRAGGLADIAISDNGVLPVEIDSGSSLKDTLIDILGDESRRRRLGRRARSSACSRFDLHAVGDRYLQLFA